eukprot:gnl/TRDRNA2_/TRDRNA2_162169_c4_seq4.p2 gnl/TRDRNA2_/TRDRNA2_162169_c4~~gnl/TRDRNA2_/TRDRNA2_162169_c4_seq4.p2  ORF type:complete len:138 (-),score=21.90 gnl/TRDRNA2_/TRDRNA2_162169_c4_seq4:15-428(-)
MRRTSVNITQKLEEGHSHVVVGIDRALTWREQILASAFDHIGPHPGIWMNQVKKFDSQIEILLPPPEYHFLVSPKKNMEEMAPFQTWQQIFVLLECRRISPECVLNGCQAPLKSCPLVLDTNRFFAAWRKTKAMAIF